MACYRLTEPTGTDLTFCDHVFEDLQLLDLKVGVHGLVWIVPLAHDTPGSESVHLLRDGLCRQLFCSLADGQWTQTSTMSNTGLLLRVVDQALGFLVYGGLLVGLQSLELDWQAVAVPSWSVIHSVASLGVRPQDDVLVDLVQGVSDVHRSICVWRPVVESKSVALAPFILAG